MPTWQGIFGLRRAHNRALRTASRAHQHQWHSIQSGQDYNIEACSTHSVRLWVCRSARFEAVCCVQRLDRMNTITETQRLAAIVEPVLQTDRRKRAIAEESGLN